VLTACFYFPPPRVNAEGLTRKEVIKRIDYVGGFLSITGMILFMTGLQYGGYQVRYQLRHGDLSRNQHEFADHSLGIMCEGREKKTDR